MSVISANDWLTSPGQTLIRRLGHAEGDLWQYAPVSVDTIAERLRLLVVGDKTVGRASLAPSPPAAAEADGSVLDVNGVAVVGGLSSASLGGIAGVVLGVPEKADRASAELLVPAAVWKEWATEQAELWADHLNEHHYPFDVGSISVSLLVRLKADTGRVELCHNGQKYMHAAEIVKWASERDRVIALSEFACDCELNATGISAWDRYDHRFFKFEDDVLRVADSSGRYGSWDRYGDEYPNQRWAPATGTPPDPANPFHWWHENQLEIAARILELVAEGWGCSLEEILRNLTNFGQGTTEHVPVGKDTNGEPVDTLFVAWVAVRPTDSGSVA